MSKIKVNNILPLPNTDLKIWSGGVTTAGSEADPAAKITLQNSTGRVGIGTVIPVSMLHLETPGDDTANSTSLITITRNDASIADEDELGAILFGGTLNGTTHNSNAVVVRALADGAWSDVSSDAGGKLQIMTTPAGVVAVPAVRVTITGSGDVGIGTASPSCMLHVAGAAAFSGPSSTFVTFSGTDPTPSVATGNLFKTHASVQTLTTFDDGVAGQTITVISTAAVTYNVSGALKGGSTNIVTASGDVTQWVFDGTNWYLLTWMDVSANLSSGGF